MVCWTLESQCKQQAHSATGRGGGIYVDGRPLTAECALPACGEYMDFGRMPQNDGQADSAFRLRSFPINRTVTTIELRVNDISDSSEIYIDDLIIAGLSVPFRF